ncbi:MAG: hypothetical protein PHO12_09000, partial [Bacteroidales bacterium]|nr:hypothetical protein [Bacteroidales bacterium]
LDKCFQILTKAYIYKGLNIDSEKIKSMAVLFCEDITKKYGYVSIFKIDEVLQENKYGEGFNVSIKGLIDVLDTHLYEINKANKLRAIELEREANTPLLSDNRTEEEKQLAIVQKAYESYLQNGVFFDFNNEIFQFILENGMYDWSDEEMQRAELIAKSKAKEFVGTKLSKARMTLNDKEARSLSKIIKTDIRKHDSFGNINKTELVKLFFNRMKKDEIKVLKLTDN